MPTAPQPTRLAPSERSLGTHFLATGDSTAAAKPAMALMDLDRFRPGLTASLQTLSYGFENVVVWQEKRLRRIVGDAIGARHTSLLS